MLKRIDEETSFEELQRLIEIDTKNKVKRSDMAVAIQLVEDKYRDLLVLSIVENKSLAQIATKFGITKELASGRLDYAKRKVRQAYIKLTTGEKADIKKCTRSRVNS